MKIYVETYTHKKNCRSEISLGETDNNSNAMSIIYHIAKNKSS